MSLLRALVWLAIMGVPIAVPAQGSRDRLSDAPDGATCDYYNQGAGGLWRKRGGDWSDVDGRPYGSRPYASSSIPPDASRYPVEIDASGLVAAWVSGRLNPEWGLVLRSVGPKQGISDLASREVDELLLRPTLVLHTADGKRRLLDAAADTYLDCTTERGLGTEKVLKAGREYSALLRFELPRNLLGGEKITKAVLSVVVMKQYGESSLGIFAAQPPESPDRAPRLGLAANHPGDEDLDRDPDVWFTTGFERMLWQAEWNDFDPRSNASAVDSDASLRFEPLSGRALRVRIPKDGHLGLDIRYDFRKRRGEEPEEAYFRYYLRFADDWGSDRDGGKLPGFAGTYGRAGWGMRRSTGTAGWSMRGSFRVQPGTLNPYRHTTAIGTYAYHADIGESSGEMWYWPLGRLAALENNRWYCVEQYFKVNTPGRRDGVLRAWIDGRLVMERKGIRVRDVSQIKIESVWFDIYYGGIDPSPRDMHLYIDNVVIARKYIGPMPAGR